MNNFIKKHGYRLCRIFTQILIAIWWAGTTWVFISDTWHETPTVLHDRPFQLLVLLLIWFSYRHNLRHYQGKEKDFGFYVKMSLPTICLCSLLFYLVKLYFI